MVYLDLAEPENGTRLGDILSMAEEKNLHYPLVAINGHLRLAGSAQYYHILPFVEEALAGD